MRRSIKVRMPKTLKRELFAKAALMGLRVCELPAITNGLSEHSFEKNSLIYEGKDFHTLHMRIDTQTYEKAKQEYNRLRAAGALTMSNGKGRYITPAQIVLYMALKAAGLCEKNDANI